MPPLMAALLRTLHAFVKARYSSTVSRHAWNPLAPETTSPMPRLSSRTLVMLLALLLCRHRLLPPSEQCCSPECTWLWLGRYHNINLIGFYGVERSVILVVLHVHCEYCLLPLNCLCVKGPGVVPAVIHLFIVNLNPNEVFRALFD